MSETRLYLLAYDISNGRMLAKVAKRVGKCMVRFQKSVYVGKMDEEMTEKLFADIMKMISADDRVFILPLNEHSLNGLHSSGEPPVLAELRQDVVVL